MISTQSQTCDRFCSLLWYFRCFGTWVAPWLHLKCNQAWGRKGDLLSIEKDKYLFWLEECKIQKVLTIFSGMSFPAQDPKGLQSEVSCLEIRRRKRVARISPMKLPVWGWLVWCIRKFVKLGNQVQFMTWMVLNYSINGSPDHFYRIDVAWSLKMNKTPNWRSFYSYWIKLEAYKYIFGEHNCRMIHIIKVLSE